MNNVRVWCISNYMKLQINKTRIIWFCRKTNCHGFDCTLSEYSVTRTDCISDLGALHFHQQVDHIFSHAIRLLKLIQTATFSFSSLHSLLTLYCTLVRPKLEMTLAWNSITTSNACRLGCIQWKFVSLCHHCFFSHLDHSCGNGLNYLKLHTLGALSCYLDVLFLMNVFSGSKYCPTFFEAVSLHMPNHNVKDFSLFNIDFKCRNCPCA